METSKIVGWFLLLFGLGLMLWAFYSSYNIFIGKAPVPEIFAMGENKTPLPSQKPETPQAQMEQILQQKIGEMLPVNVLPQLLNLVAWSIFAGIMIFGGSQVTTLGIKLIK